MSCNTQPPSICKRDSTCNWVNRKTGRSYCRRHRKSHGRRSICSGKSTSICNRNSSCKWVQGNSRKFCRRAHNRKTRRMSEGNKKQRAVNAAYALGVRR